MGNVFSRAWSWLRGQPKELPAARLARAPRGTFDGYENSFMGFGTSRDRLEFGGFGIDPRLSDYELHALYYFSAFGAKAINLEPTEMLRRGYKVTSKKNAAAAEKLQKDAEERHEVGKKVLRAAQWGRLWGGSVIVIGANDSPDLTMPLNMSRARDVLFLNPVDRRYASVVRYQEDPTLPGFNDPELYAIGGTTQAMRHVHASRVVRFVGVEETDPQTVRNLAGWTHSALQRPYEILRDFAMANKSIAHLIGDSSVGVWKIANLIDMIGANRDELMTRIRFADMTKSAGRSIMVDSETEDFQRVAAQAQGLSDLVYHLKEDLCSALDVPMTKLFGRSPAGMNATGESDVRNWYDNLETKRCELIKPALLKIYRVLSAGAIDDLDIEFPPFWQPTAKEQADKDYTIAQTDKIYFDMGLEYERILMARFGSGDGKITIDEEALEASLKHETELLKNPELRPDPTPPDDGSAEEEEPPPGDEPSKEESAS